MSSPLGTLGFFPSLHLANFSMKNQLRIYRHQELWSASHKVIFMPTCSNSLSIKQLSSSYQPRLVISKSACATFKLDHKVNYLFPTCSTASCLHNCGSCLISLSLQTLVPCTVQFSTVKLQGCVKGIHSWNKNLDLTRNSYLYGIYILVDILKISKEINK